MQAKNDDFKVKF